MNKSLDILKLESIRNEFIEKSLNTNSNHSKLFLFFNYFGTVLSAEDQNLNEVFLKEFIYDYLTSIKKYEAFGINPEFTTKLLLQLKNLTSLTFITEILPELNSEIGRIEKQKEKLNHILEGKEYEDGIEHKAFFSLVDKEVPDNFYGIIESVTIRINKTSNSDKFIIVPSEREIEKRIIEQCKKSWIVALDLLREYIKKPYKYHEVIISFDKKEGFYEGNSLGTALTLSFLEELLKFYNPAYIIKIKEQTAFTGGITEIGEVLCTSEEIIKQKVAAIFFSEINTFVVPKLEETYAYFALTQLRNQYPQRNLKLIPAIDINDVLNRRDLVEVKKINPAVRTGKLIKKNWASVLITLIITVILSFLFVLDFDDNPYSVYADNGTIHIKNKNGKILWTKRVSLSEFASPNELKIIDINSDGMNEVLLTNENSNDIGNLVDPTTLRCFDYNGKLIWKYLFNDTVLSKREELDNEYKVRILDTLTIYGEKSLYLFSQNIKSFSSAIFRIDLQTGKRLKGTFWCSGFIEGGLIKDINNDGKKDILCIGFDNAYEDAVLFSFETDTLIKVRPTTEDYLIRNFPVAELLTYIRFPKNDYEIKFKQRFTLVNGWSLNESKTNDIEFVTHIYKNPERRANLADAVFYKVNKNLKNVDVFISDDFRLERDSLVVQGKLKPPFTDTREYKEIIKSKILYYKDGKWVKREELD